MIIGCFEIHYIGFSAWKATARTGKRIQAMVAYRIFHPKATLQQVKSVVDSYMWRHKIIPVGLSPYEWKEIYRRGKEKYKIPLGDNPK